MNLFSLTNQHALVTGASSGLGRHFAAVLANAGPERRVQLVVGAQALEIDLPADSVHTLEWA